jgi:Spy/CpxP family protein refolding chaperone
MTRTKIAVYLALIFVAGGVAGAGLRAIWKPEQPAARQVRIREDFANHIFSRMKERLELTPEQITQIEPVFRKGWDHVRAIQEQSLKQVETAVKQNHEEIAQFLTADQREKLEAWERERVKYRRGGRRQNGNGPGGSATSGEMSRDGDKGKGERKKDESASGREPIKNSPTE